MKISAIRKILIKQTAIALVIVGVFIGAVFYLDSYDEEFDRNISTLKSEADNIMHQVANLSSEYSKVVGDMAIYNDIKKKQDDKKLIVSKIALRDAIAKAREKYHLDGLDVKMDEIKALAGDKYKRNTAFMEASNTTISLNGLTDLDVFGLINDLSQAFLGIKFTSLKLASGVAVDNAALISIKNSGFAPIVNAKITFTLFGLRSVSNDDNDLLGEGKEEQPNPGADDGKKLIRLRPR